MVDNLRMTVPCRYSYSANIGADFEMVWRYLNLVAASVVFTKTSILPPSLTSRFAPVLVYWTLNAGIAPLDFAGVLVWSTKQVVEVIAGIVGKGFTNLQACKSACNAFR